MAEAAEEVEEEKDGKEEDSDDPWRLLKEEVCEQYQSEFDERVIKHMARQGEDNMLPTYRKTLANIFINEMLWFHTIRKDRIYLSVKNTVSDLKLLDDYDKEEAWKSAVNKCKILFDSNRLNVNLVSPSEQVDLRAKDELLREGKKKKKKKKDSVVYARRHSSDRKNEETEDYFDTIDSHTGSVKNERIALKMCDLCVAIFLLCDVYFGNNKLIKEEIMSYYLNTFSNSSLILSMALITSSVIHQTSSLSHQEPLWAYPCFARRGLDGGGTRFSRHF